MKSIKIVFTLLILPFISFAQSKLTKDYVEKYKGIAISEMKRTGIPASITLAQAILESASGESNLAKNGNNHFGIKCKTEWTGPKMYQNDDAKNECFRVYPNADSSFKDHSNFLKFRPYYAALFELDPVDDTAWAYGLKKAGYATQRDYPQRLLKIIDDYELAQYNFPELVEEDSIETEKIKDTPKKELLIPTKKEIIIAKDSMAVSKNVTETKSIALAKDTIVKKLTPAIKITLEKKDTLVKKDTELKKVALVNKEAVVIKDTVIKKLPPPYPLNQRFKINQTTAIWGEKGRSFLEIANTYQIALYKLYKFNELPETDLIENDQIIFLGEKRKESKQKIHIVKNEESLYDISQSEGIQFDVIKLYNPKLNTEKLKNGTIVYLFNMKPTDPIK